MDISFEYRARAFDLSSGRGAGSSGKSKLETYYWFGSKKRYTYPVELEKSSYSLRKIFMAKVSH